MDRIPPYDVPGQDNLSGAPHPQDCNCYYCATTSDSGRCYANDDILDSPDDERPQTLIEMRQAMEDRVLAALEEQTLPYLSDDRNGCPLPTTYHDEPHAVITGILRRFENGCILFSCKEVYILSLEATHALHHHLFPRRSLIWFLLGVYVKFGSEVYQETFAKIVDGGMSDAAGYKALELLKDIQPAFHNWLDRIQDDPDRFMMKFRPDGTAALIETSPRATMINIDNRDSEVLRHLPRDAFDPFPDCEVRKMMIRNNPKEKKHHPQVFIRGGRAGGFIQMPYWTVALATDQKGHRYLSDKKLDKLIRDWRSLLTNTNTQSPRFNRWVEGKEEFLKWVDKEMAKLRALGMAWPAPYVPRANCDMGNPRDPTEVLPVVSHSQWALDPQTETLKSSSEDLTVLNSSSVQSPSEMGSASKQGTKNTSIKSEDSSAASDDVPKWSEVAAQLNNFQSTMVRIIQEGGSRVLQEQKTVLNNQQIYLAQVMEHITQKIDRLALQQQELKTTLSQRISYLDVRMTEVRRSIDRAFISHQQRSREPTMYTPTRAPRTSFSTPSHAFTRRSRSPARNDPFTDGHFDF